MFCRRPSKLCSVLALMKKSSLATANKMAVIHVWAAGHDRHVKAVIAIGAVDKRLVEPPCSAPRDPVGAERNLVERLRARRRERHRNGETRQ